MMKPGMFAAALLAALTLLADEAKPVAELPAKAVLARCQAMLPVKPMELKGALVLRNRKGIVRSEYSYTLVLDRSRKPATAAVTIFERDTTNELKSVKLTRPGEIPPGKVMDTDVSWLDLALDYLWWNNPRYEERREGESVHGQKCTVILTDSPDAAQGAKSARLWVDSKNGCIMQVEELNDQGEPFRRLWGTRVKKFGERWMANVLETETLGSGRRTKITVESIREL